MTVAELIKELQERDPTDLVVMSSDAEGNDFDTLESVTTAHYHKRELVDGADGEPCIVLWP